MRYGDQEEVEAMLQTYSQEVCSSFMDAMHQAFPREIRDMVYNDLFSVEDCATGSVCGMLQDIVSDKFASPQGLIRPWFLDVAVVGDIAQREMFELLHARVFAQLSYSTVNFDSLHRLGTADVFCCGLLPIHFVRSLRVVLDFGHSPIRGKLRDPLCWPSKPDQPSWKSCFANLRQVNNKRYFHIWIIIQQWGPFSKKHVGHFLEVFRPLHCELATAGAHIDLRLDVNGGGRLAPIELCQFYGQRKAKWGPLLQRLMGDIDLEWRRARKVKYGRWPAWETRWDEEGDEAFDEAMESGLISYKD